MDPPIWQPLQLLPKFELIIVESISWYRCLNQIIQNSPADQVSVIISNTAVEVDAGGMDTVVLVETLRIQRCSTQCLGGAAVGEATTSGSTEGKLSDREKCKCDGSFREEHCR